ncbi:Trp biosynthesis-associated membrane protein [Microbacterium sp. gxy059]|uniref:Trp biosynthesis-associated membrane protein n=1 Tax=Microbacterium sp. gxy059 TaxID=2957199 RepID=UPI003D978636
MLAIIAGGALALISSTQTWAVARVAGADVPAPGSEALSLLQPLSLAALALALALALAGRATRVVLSILAIAIGGGLVAIAAPVIAGDGLAAVQTTVTEHTGLAGEEALSDLVERVALTPWPVIAACCGALVVAGGVLALATGRRWRDGGRRYGASTRRAQTDESVPLDAVDSWDELSRGDDPTRPDA